MSIVACGALLTAACAAVPTALPGTGMRQPFNGDSVKGTVFLPGDSVPRFGFVPIRLATDNQQPRELRWQAGFEVTYNQNTGPVLVARTTTAVTIPASRAGERWVFVPTVGAGGGINGPYGGWTNFVMTLDGPGLGQPRINFNAGNRANAMVPWAVSAGLESPVRSHLVGLKADSAAMRGSYRPGRVFPSTPQPLLRGAPNIFVFDPMQGFGDWRIWTPFARVVIRADEFAAMPPANRAALRGWVALGGALYLVPETSAPLGREGLGAGEIISLSAPVSPTGEHNSDGLLAPGALFNFSLALPQELSLQKGGLADKVPPAKRAGDWLVYFFVGFAVLIAPVNLFAIAPVKRRHWLFITVPAISFAAVAVLVFAIYFQDGVGGDGARRAVVILLPGENQAAVFQEQVSRTGLLFGASFAIADDAICAPVPADDTNVQPNRPLEYVRQDGQASGDWFRGRARQGQHLRRLTPTRARVELVATAPNGAPVIQSSVGAALRNFCYVDEAGIAWTSDDVAPGVRATLTRRETATEFTERVSEFTAVLSPTLHAIADAGAGVRNGMPPRGRFVALADESELAPLPTLASIRWKDSAVLLTGAIDATAIGKATP